MGKIGIIGGSAVGDIDDMVIKGRRKVETPFGAPSDEFIIGEMAGKEIIFLPRHGAKHTILPTEVNNAANIYAFKVLGAENIISVSAVGSLKEEVRPLDILLVDQFVDRTNQGRKMTFFGDGIVAHIPFADPVCPRLREVIYESNRDTGVTVHNGGTYVNMEGPAFSTKAESFLYRSWGVAVIGMTNMGEARLAREAGICYATIAMVTDYDCWHSTAGVETVTADVVIANVMKNITVAKKMLRNTILKLADNKDAAVCGCREALKNAIMTPREAVPAATLNKLKPILEGFI